MAIETRAVKSLEEELANQEAMAIEPAVEETKAASEPAAEEPAAEPEVQAAAEEEPVALEPVVEETAADEPAEEPAEEPAAEEPAPEETASEEIAAEESAPEEPAPEEPAVEPAESEAEAPAVIQVAVEPQPEKKPEAKAGATFDVDVAQHANKPSTGAVFDVDVAPQPVSEPVRADVFDVDVSAPEYSEEDQLGELTDRILSLGEGSMEEDMIIGAPSQRKPFRFFRRRGAEPPEQTLMAEDEIPEATTEEVKVTKDHEDDVVAADAGAEEPEASAEEAEPAEPEEAEAEEAEPEAPAAKPSRRPVRRVAKPAEPDEDVAEEADEDEASPKSKSTDEDRVARPVRRSVTQAPVKKDRPTRKRDEAVQVSGTRTTPFAFIRQAVGELRKVVWPSGDQVGQYFVVVLVFVLFLMLVVAGLDYLFGQALLALFR